MVVSRLPRAPLGSPEPAAPPPGDAEPDGALPPGGDPEAPDPRGPLGRMPVAGLSRRSLAIVVGVLVVGWIVFVFARAVADSAASSDKVDVLREQTAAAAARLQAKEHELEIIQSPEYLALQARAYGYGRSDELAFALEADAPSPRPITPLGAAPGSGGRSTPLDDWLELLFGP
jgi:hypothetical protein